jgi:hypothetical protein
MAERTQQELQHLDVPLRQRIAYSQGYVGPFKLESARLEETGCHYFLRPGGCDQIMDWSRTNELGLFPDLPLLIRSVLQYCNNLEELSFMESGVIHLVADAFILLRDSHGSSPQPRFSWSQNGVVTLLTKCIARLSHERGVFERAADALQAPDPGDYDNHLEDFDWRGLPPETKTAPVLIDLTGEGQHVFRPFLFLADHGLLHLIITWVHKDDAFCVALTCRPARDVLMSCGKDIPGNSRLMDTSDFFSNHPFVGYRYSTRPEAILQSVRRTAWAFSSFPVLKCLHLDGPRAAHICAVAASIGALATLQWLRSWGTPWDDRTCSGAARGGHLAVLQWARSEGCDWSSATCSQAALGGHLSILQWARENGCAWGTDTCSSAARVGHLVILNWLQSQDCERNNDTFFEAARGGHLTVLQWALTESLQPDSWTPTHEAPIYEDVPSSRRYGRTRDEFHRVESGERVPPLRDFPWEWTLHWGCPFTQRAVGHLWTASGDCPSPDCDTLDCTICTSIADCTKFSMCCKEVPVSYTFLMCKLAAEEGPEAVYSWRTYYRCGSNRALILFLLACVWELRRYGSRPPVDTDPTDSHYSPAMQRGQALNGLIRLLRGNTDGLGPLPA